MFFPHFEAEIGGRSSKMAGLRHLRLWAAEPEPSFEASEEARALEKAMARKDHVVRTAPPPSPS